MHFIFFNYSHKLISHILPHRKYKHAKEAQQNTNWQHSSSLARSFSVTATLTLMYDYQTNFLKKCHLSTQMSRASEQINF